jgi:putative ABC transport system permease protein
VLGFTTDEVAGLTWKEIIMQSILGIALGLPFGRVLSKAIIQATASDLYTLPLIISPRTYIICAVGGIIFIAVAHRFAVREIKGLDLVELMKNQD